jgi:hypothetical protein
MQGFHLVKLTSVIGVSGTIIIVTKIVKIYENIKYILYYIIFLVSIKPYKK